MDSLNGVGDARSLAQVILETVREPLLVLDENLQILAASDSFHKLVQVTAGQTFHHAFFTMGDGAWNIPALRELLGRALVESDPVEGFEFAHDFPRAGLRHFLIHVRRVNFDRRNRTTLLMGFEDITDRLAVEADKAQLQVQTDKLLKKEQILREEMQHRIVNSLQIIASILVLKARSVTSDETRAHLRDAHSRVMSVAEVQKYLHSTVGQETVDLASYLTKLCTSLAASMIGDASDVKLQVECGEGTVASADAVSIGLIVTELVINALKYAFPEKRASAVVKVRYETNGGDWKLSVSDNGVGKTADTAHPTKGGLGTSLVAALAHQLEAEVEIKNSAGGMSVSVTHAVFNAVPAKTLADPHTVNA